MIRLDLYAYGSGIKVRLHDHVGTEDGSCGEYCEEHSCQRAYPQYKDTPQSIRNQVALAAVAALMEKSLSHKEFQNMLGWQEPLF